jgi:hypothetical protein
MAAKKKAASSLAVPPKGTASRGSFYLGSEGKSKKPNLDRALEKSGFSYEDRGTFHDRAFAKAERDSALGALMSKRDSVNASIEDRFGDMMGDEARSARRDSVRARAGKPVRRKS